MIASNFFNKDHSFNNHKYDMLIVSSWRGNIGYPIDQIDTMNSMRVMDNLMFKYVTKNNIKAAVILRNERDGEHWFVPEIGKNEENRENRIGKHEKTKNKKRKKIKSGKVD